MPETTQFGGGDSSDQYSGALKPNTILRTRYKILGVIGGGGMGTVYQARDLNFPDANRLVAVKEMLNQTADPSLRANTLNVFKRESNILAELSHPATPKIYDFFDQNDRAYLIMEFINGSDLEMIINKTKELPIDKIIEWAIDLCDVLEYLHSQQPQPIIFRDMKPANIMIDSNGRIRLIDFGIAKAFDSSAKSHTMIGTEGYSAPEQYKGNVSPLSDIYSLGATLHHLITREDPRLQPPFSFSERPLHEYNASAPKGLAEIIDKALEFNEKDRYQSCAEMKAALERMRLGVHSMSFGGNGDAVGEPTLTGLFDDMGGIEPRWKFKTEDEIRSSPTTYKNLAFIGSYDTNVWAINLENGQQVWKFPTKGGIAASPVVDEQNNLVLFGSEDHTFHAVDITTGKINWSYTTKDKIRSTARVAHGYVFFGSDDGRLYALVSGNGRYHWEYDMGAPVRCRPFVTNDLVIVGCDSGEIMGLELSGNERKWSFRARGSITSSPYVDTVEGVCYVGSFGNYVYALDAKNGYRIWQFRTNGPVIATPASDGRLTYFGSADKTLYAVNAESGKEKWRLTLDKPIVSSPVLYQDALYFGGTDGYLYCVDKSNGTEKWKFKTDGPITSTPCIVGNMILTGSIDQTLYALPLVS